LALCDLKNKFLFEVMPTYFPEGYLTETEIILWELFYQQKAEIVAKQRNK